MAGRRAALIEPLQGSVEGLNHEGWGVVKAGRTVFVAGALPGETIEYRIRRRRGGFEEGELLRVITPSPDRVVPRCAHFGQCGGCALQHLSTASQLAQKDQMLRETLRRIGHVEPETWLAPLAGEPWAYRRRARLGARYVFSQRRSLVGFREKHSSHVAALERCEVLAPPVGDLMRALSDLVTSLSCPERIPQIEVAIGDNATVLVMRHLQALTDPDRDKLAAFGREHGVHWLLQPGGPEVLDPVGEPAPQLEYELPAHGLKLAFEPADFIQVNGPMNRQLIDHVLSLLELDAGSRVLDMFCGLGNFTLPIARHSTGVLGLEGDAGLIRRAAANARSNGLSNASFAVANLAGAEASGRCLALARRDLPGPITHLLLDPPRTGALDVLPAVAELAPQRVVYVSCHPGSLARDLGILVTGHGYRLRSAGIVDMFPQTSHVESVAVLERERR